MEGNLARPYLPMNGTQNEEPREEERVVVVERYNNTNAVTSSSIGSNYRSSMVRNNSNLTNNHHRQQNRLVRKESWELCSTPSDVLGRAPLLYPSHLPLYPPSHYHSSFRAPHLSGGPRCAGDSFAEGISANTFGATMSGVTTTAGGPYNSGYAINVGGVGPPNGELSDAGGREPYNCHAERVTNMLRMGPGGVGTHTPTDTMTGFVRNGGGTIPTTMGGGPPVTRPQTKHRLQFDWCLWAADYSSQRQEWEAAEEADVRQPHGERYIRVHPFNTVEDFWCMYHFALPPSKGKDYCLFKKELNVDELLQRTGAKDRKGGRWVMQFSSNAPINELWLKLAIGMLGENFEMVGDVLLKKYQLRNKQTQLGENGQTNQKHDATGGGENGGWDSMECRNPFQPSEEGLWGKCILGGVVRSSLYETTDIQQMLETTPTREGIRNHDGHSDIKEAGSHEESIAINISKYVLELWLSEIEEVTVHVLGQALEQMLIPIAYPISNARFEIFGTNPLVTFYLKKF